MADLTKRFAEEKDRKLGAQFLEKLLMGTLPGLKLHRHGVQITGAIIDQSIDLKNPQIPCDVRLEECHFTGDAIFNGMKAGGDVSFDCSVFEGPVYFIRAEIAGDFTAKKAEFRGKDNDFESMKVAGRAFFDDAKFEGQVNVYFADFGSLSLLNASLPKVTGLSQLHYKYIRADHGADSHKALFQLAKKMPYSGTWYSRLEDFFYAKAIGPKQTKLSLKENVRSGNNGSAAVAGSCG